MSFLQWLAKFDEHQDPLGDFARDALTDPAAALIDTRQGWLLHLDSRNACDGALDAFERAWKRYAAEVRRDAQGF